jgi:hypothetical protein
MWPIIPDSINLVIVAVHAIWPWLPVATVILRLVTALITLTINICHVIHEWHN